MLKLTMKSKWVLLIVLTLLITSCSKYQRLLKSDDVNLKKEKAYEYYYKGDYHRALGLISDIIPAFRGTVHAEQLNYYFAMAHYKQGDYILAAHYFKTFTQGFPRSEHAEEFLFMSAYCKYLLSPRASLDQTDTREAISELQSFINRYPRSERVEEANILIDELREKLEEKAFQSAKLYFNIRDYMAAVTSFNNVIRDFPDTQYREESLFYIIRSHFLFAENSIQVRQLERYQKVLQAHRRLANRFPDSEFMTDADRMLARSKERIAELEEIAAAQTQDN
ncbi:MAG: outer membrane protein assembly factor BamD [Bacteroidetes bacterium]|nr:MAG: outer membrane protein assembly factor BamD [Bacteroidota bacterium]